jgi:hypothetical protein
MAKTSRLTKAEPASQPAKPAPEPSPERYDVFVKHERRWTALTADAASDLMQLDPHEIEYWVEEAGRCDTVDDAGRTLIAVATGDSPDMYEAP